jgi:hypothetical protein
MITKTVFKKTNTLFTIRLFACSLVHLFTLHTSFVHSLHSSLVHSSLVHLFTCSLFILHLFTLFTCSLSSPVHSLHLFTLFTCSLSSPVHSLHLFTLFTCSLFSQLPAYTLSSPESLAQVPNDLMKLEQVNEATTLHVLHCRFKRDRCVLFCCFVVLLFCCFVVFVALFIDLLTDKVTPLSRFYTSVGPILVSVNPFKWITGLYSQDVIQYFVDSRFAYDATLKRHAETPPHTFAVAERAFIALASEEAR